MRGWFLLVLLISLSAVNAKRLDAVYHLWPKILELPEIHEKSTIVIRSDGSGDEKDEDKISMTKKEREEDDLTFDTIWYNGTHTRTSVTVVGEGKFGSYSVDVLRAHGIIKHKAKRVRRMVFGQDNRFQVNAKYTQVYPFSATVRLSTGCTGTLVSPRHVLTAAHCVYNPKTRDKKSKRKGGKRNGKGSLSVGFLTKNGDMRYVKAKRSMLPKNWLKKFFPRYNYAVIELMRKMDRRHMQLGVLDTFLERTDQYLHFNAYDTSKNGQLLYRFCNITRETQEMLYSKCDSRVGSDGAGVYIRLYNVEDDTWQRKIIGVYSANERDPISDKYNSAVRITTLKYAQMCYWITGKYDSCKGK